MATATDIQFDAILREAKSLIDKNTDSRKALQDVCQLLHEKIPHYDWVGFYLVNPENSKELVLGPFSGAPTEHTHIPFGKGVCGQVAERKETIIVQDVSKESNYLSCSLHVKSEIVVPLLRAGRFLGELDIDSHTLAPFTAADRRLLEGICMLLTDKFTDFS
ncbi:MAG: GAF domain-containing protein [Calditrichaeota bacterium]|nr:MAG: GAF domain-containing protein [Calditrichota bacterium]